MQSQLFLIKTTTYLHIYITAEFYTIEHFVRILISVFSREDDSAIQATVATDFLEISVIRLGVLGSQETAR